MISPRAPRFAVRLAALLLALAALPAVAQSLPPPTPLLHSDTRVLPVWSNASGRVEALLLLDPIEDAARTSALDRVLNRSAAVPSLGLGNRIRLDNGGELRSSLQLDGDAGLALLCEGRRGIAGTLGALGERCLLATLGHDDPLLGGSSRGANLGLGWRSPNQVFDLSFGLSWLELDAAPEARLHALGQDNPSANLLGTGLDILGIDARHFESRGMHLDSLINLGPQARMLLGGDLGRSRVHGFDGTPLDWESAALSLGLGLGDFSGQLTGRLIELPRDGSHWTTLDIGLSWRTPWRGELSVGARNVLGGADHARWPLSDLPALEDSTARVPYVRYQQDL